MTLLSIALPLMIFIVLMSLTYLNEDEKRANAFKDYDIFYRATSLGDASLRERSLQFQSYVYAAHVMAFGYVVLNVPLELLIFIGSLWLPFFVAHTLLFRGYFLRWSDASDKVAVTQKHKRDVTQDMLQRLATNDQHIEQRKDHIRTTYYREFHNQLFR